MATLGAELGCGRHLASTVVTGSGQWSSTFLAELCLSTVLVLALRAFHCRPRRKKRARCPARVTSRMVDASRFSCGGQDRHRRLLCPRCQRPPRRRAAEKRDELAAFHSITSSAHEHRADSSSILCIEPCVDNFLCLGNNRFFGTFLKRCRTFGQRR